MAARDRVLQSSLFGNTILQKLQALAEVNDERQARVEENTAKAVTSLNAVERLLAVQNNILMDIRKSMAGRGTERVTGGIDLKDLPKFGLMATGAAAASIVAMSAAIALSANILNFVPEGNLTMLSKFMVALGTVGTLALVAPSFVKLVEVLGGMKTTTSSTFNGVSFATGKLDIGGALATLGRTALAMIGMSAAIAISSHILRLTESSADMIDKLATAVMISLIMLTMAPVFIKTVDILSRMQSSISFEGMGGSGANTMGMLGVIGGSLLAIVGMAASIALSSYIMSLIVPVSPDQLISALAIGIVLIPIAYAYSMVLKAMPGSSLGSVIIAAIAIPLMITGIAIALRSWNFYAPIAYAPLPPIGYFLAFGFIAIVTAATFYVLTKAVKGLSFGEVLMAAAAIPLMVGGLAIALRSWNFYAPIAYAPLPPIGYFLAFGFIAIVTAATFYVLAKAVKGLSIKEVLMAAAAIPLMVGGLALALHVWNLLAPDEMPTGEQAMDPAWALKTAIGLTFFALPTQILGKLTLKTIGTGVAGILLLTAAIIGIIWTASMILPDNSNQVADALSYIMMSPVNALVDVLKRLVNEVGVDNLFPLAGGIIAIAGAMMTLSAAMIGIAVGDVANAIGNLVGGALDKITEFVTGDKQSSGTVETLLLLANNAAKIQALAMPLTLVSKAMGRIGAIQPAVIDKAAKFLKDLDKYKFDKQAIALAKIANSYASIAKSSNGMDVEALKETNNMFTILNELAKNNTTAQIEKLSEALVNALKELANVVSEIKPTPTATPTAAPVTTTQNAPQASNVELISKMNEMISSLEGVLRVKVVSQEGL